jgi:hypothetical protein
MELFNIRFSKISLTKEKSLIVFDYINEEIVNSIKIVYDDFLTYIFIK